MVIGEILIPIYSQKKSREEFVMKRVVCVIASVALTVSALTWSQAISAKASNYYEIAKVAGAEGREVKIGVRYFYYENRTGCGKAYRYYKYYTKAMRDKYICPGNYFGKHSWTNGKKLFYIIKNQLIKVKLYSDKIKSKKLGSKKYKYKIKKIHNKIIYIQKSRKHKKKIIKYSIKKGKVLKRKK